MPFKFRWPFSWPGQKRPRAAASGEPGSSSTAAPVGSNAGVVPSAAQDSAAPVQLVRAEEPPPSIESKPAAATQVAEGGEGPDLGLELLGRVPTLATPPTLGRLGGLPAMAQALPSVERFLRNLPAPPAPPLLAGLSDAGDFASGLPSLFGFTSPSAAGQRPAFPAQLDAPSEPTDVLAPPGGMPGQIAGLSGAAPVLTPERQAPVQPTIVRLPATTPPLAPSPVAAPVKRDLEPTSLPAKAPGPPLAPRMPLAPAIVPPPGGPAAVVPGILGGSTWTPPAAPMTLVLPLEQTLTGNVLPSQEAAPIQREVIQRREDEWSAPAEFVKPAEQPTDITGERIRPEQRDAIESQRGQGRPLEPDTRQRFEQAYGQPLDDVRVHTGPTAHATAESLNAIAFASGPDLFFTQNTYAPDSPQGLSLIGHELAHVIQQQYGVPGDADVLRPLDDRYERQADQLAARALAAPLEQLTIAAAAARSPASVQRASDDELRAPGSPVTLPVASIWAPGDQLSTAASTTAPEQPLAAPRPLTGKLPDEEPIQRYTAAGVSSAGIPEVAGPEMSAARLPSLERVPERLGSLSDQWLSPVAMFTNQRSLSQDLPGLGSVSEAGQALPVFRSISRGLPGLGSVPDLARNLPEMGQLNLPDAGAPTDQLPNAPAGLPGFPSVVDNAPSMPDLGGLAYGLAGGSLPQMPSLTGGLTSLGGLTLPAMPLAEGLGAGQAAGDAAGGALAAGQQALGSITSVGPAGAEAPAAPALPSLEKLTEHIWKEVQRKLKVERERSRGLA